MTPERRLDRARDRLREARIQLDNDLYDVACNRAYYAAFEAALSILTAQGLSLPKTHSGVNSQFHQRIVKTGLIDQDIGASLSKIEYKRLMADYMDEAVDVGGAGEAVEMATKFVAAVESKLEQMIAGRKEGQE